MGRSQREHADGDGGAGHVDGRAQRDGDAVGVLIQAQALGQCQVHRNVGGRAAREEGRHRALAQAGQHQRIGVAARLCPDDERVHHQGHEEHAAQQHGQQVRVVQQLFQARLGKGAGHQAEDAQRRQPDHALDHAGDGLAQVLHHGARGLRGMAQGHAHGQCPGEDADVVGIHQRTHGVVEGALHQGHQHFANAPGRALGRGGILELDGGREGHAGSDGDHGRCKGAQHIQPQDGADLRGLARPVVAGGRDHQQQHQHGRDGLEGGDEQRAQQGHGLGGLGPEPGQQAASDQADGDLADQAGAGKPGEEGFEHDGWQRKGKNSSDGKMQSGMPVATVHAAMCRAAGRRPSRAV